MGCGHDVRSMAMRLQILGSSSSGNCALLETAGARVLIDAGFSARRIGDLLSACGVELSSLDAVLLTHEHGDHSCGLRGLKRYGVPALFANAATIAGLSAEVRVGLPWKVFETGTTFRFRDLEICTFLVPHDAMEPVGFVIRTGGEDLFHPQRTLGWVTDLGFVPELVRERVRGCDLLVLEANHDHELLDRDTKRPWAVKQRIRGRHGHLSNDSAREFLDAEPKAGWNRVLLGHLSKDCNDPALVSRQLACDRTGAARRYSVTVLDPCAPPGPWITV